MEELRTIRTDHTTTKEVVVEDILDQTMVVISTIPLITATDTVPIPIMV